MKIYKYPYQATLEKWRQGTPADKFQVIGTVQACCRATAAHIARMQLTRKFYTYNINLSLGKGQLYGNDTDARVFLSGRQQFNAVAALPLT
jgi:hypothetical protein